MRHAARLTLVLAALALAAHAPAASPASAVGTWDAVASTPEGDMASVIVVTPAEGGIKAEIELAGSKRTVTDEKIEGDLLRMKVQYEGTVYDVEAKIDGDALDGSWQGGGYSGTLKAKRRP
jgi:hypothetical protein